MSFVFQILKRSFIIELRKLKLSYKGLTMKYKKWSVVDEFADPTSELYAPLMRHGEHPKRGHQVIDEHLKKYRAQFEGVFIYRTVGLMQNNIILNTVTKIYMLIAFVQLDLKVY